MVLDERSAALLQNLQQVKSLTMAGAFCNGLIISFIPALLLVFMGDVGFEGTTFGDSDFGVVGILILMNFRKKSPSSSV
ncbi:hypothetical protein M3568_06230 [Priestia flexa]|uniref:hypothetical protein n=1 Tax=Priestia flexa TaxID=86664 RepID=UPI00203AA07C|nr:hypothetical protein [Priestia flexa]MCM3066031.1 hypothetical protein [Priestia flexa]